MFSFKGFVSLCVLSCGLSSSMMGAQWLGQKNFTRLTERSENYGRALTTLNEYKDEWFKAYVASRKVLWTAGERLDAVLNDPQHTLEAKSEARQFYESATLASKKVFEKYLQIKRIIQNVDKPSNDVDNDRLNLEYCGLWGNIVVYGRNLFKPSVSQLIDSETWDRIDPKNMGRYLSID